jgi:hypothetical protein
MTTTICTMMCRLSHSPKIFLHISKNPTWHCMRWSMRPLTCSIVLALRGHPTRREPRPQRSRSWPSTPQTNEVIDDPGATTNSCTTPPKTRRRRRRPRRGPRRTGRLANHHHAYSVATADTVAPCHTLPRRGHKTMTTTMPRLTPQEDIACKAKLARTSLRLTTLQSGEPPSLYTP